MKLLTLLAAMLLTQTAMAQVFTIGADGEALADKAEINVTDVETQPFTGKQLMNSHLFIRNTTASDVYVKVEYEVEAIDNGSMQICYPGSCINQTSTGTYTTGGPDHLTPGSSADMMTEWFPAAEGKCRVRYTIKRFSKSGTPLASAATVTVNYLNGTAAISNPLADDVKSIRYYDLSGRETKTLSRGVYIQQTTYINGRVAAKKVIR